MVGSNDRTSLQQFRDHEQYRKLSHPSPPQGRQQEGAEAGQEDRGGSGSRAGKNQFSTMPFRASDGNPPTVEEPEDWSKGATSSAPWPSAPKHTRPLSTITATHRDLRSLAFIGIPPGEMTRIDLSGVLARDGRIMRARYRAATVARVATAVNRAIYAFADRAKPMVASVPCCTHAIVRQGRRRREEGCRACRHGRREHPRSPGPGDAVRACRLLDDRRQDDVAVVDARVVALEIDGAGPEFVGPQGAAGAAEERLVVDDLLAVENHGHVPVHERDVHGLPLAGGFLGGHARA